MDKVVDRKFNKLVGDIHRSCLKGRGFKKTANMFRLYRSPEMSNIIYFQKSRWNYGEECRFTINVGVYLQPDLEQPNSRFREYDCQIGTRIGGISNRYEGDHWWTITEETDDQVLYKEFLFIFEKEILPWLDQFETWLDIVRKVKAGELKGMLYSNNIKGEMRKLLYGTAL